MPRYLINDMTTYSIDAPDEHQALQLYLEDGEDKAQFEDQDVQVVGEVDVPQDDWEFAPHGPFS